MRANPYWKSGDEPILRRILRNCWMLACVEVPVEAFIVEANVGILTSLVFLEKKTNEEIDAEAQGHVFEYPDLYGGRGKAGVVNSPIVTSTSSCARNSPDAPRWQRMKFRSRSCSITLSTIRRRQPSSETRVRTLYTIHTQQLWSRWKCLGARLRRG